MTGTVWTYKGYTAAVDFDASADAFHGRVLGINDVVDFYGRTVDELREALRASVDDYLAMCVADGVEPERAWKGKFTLRPNDEERRRWEVARATEGYSSLNAWALAKLDAAARKAEAEAVAVEGDMA